jgi:hypothetical protein
MTETGYLVWIVATAIMIIVVLTIGTLAAADLLRRETADPHAPHTPMDSEESTAPELSHRDAA